MRCNLINLIIINFLKNIYRLQMMFENPEEKQQSSPDENTKR
jgi:hypothetical protein